MNFNVGVVSNDIYYFYDHWMSRIQGSHTYLESKFKDFSSTDIRKFKDQMDSACTTNRVRSGTVQSTVS